MTLVRVIVHEPTGSLCTDKDGSFTGSVDCSNHPDFRLKCQHGQEAVIKTLEIQKPRDRKEAWGDGAKDLLTSKTIGRCDICRAWTSNGKLCESCQYKTGTP